VLDALSSIGFKGGIAKGKRFLYDTHIIWQVLTNACSEGVIRN
jgi:hypothetical protein